MNRIFIYLALLLFIPSGIAAQDDWVSLGTGSVKIALGSPGLVLKGVRVYPGEEIKLVASGKVRYNWEEKVEKDCFLWWCDETRIIYNNFRSPGNLPAKIFFTADDDNTSLNNGGFSLSGTSAIKIPDQYAYTKPFRVYGYFDDPGINRLRSDGEYDVTAYANFAGRLNYLRNFLSIKGASLTFDMVNSKDFISDLFAKTCADKIAMQLADHISRNPSIPAQEQQLLLNYIYKLDPSNPKISLALAKNALDRFNMTMAEDAIKRAKALIQAGGGDDLLMGDAYFLFGRFYQSRYESTLDGSNLGDASSNFGMAAEYYLKAGQYDNAIQAYYNQSKSLKAIGYTEALQKSLEVLGKADALSSRQYIITKDGRYGFMNNFGKITVIPQFDSIRNVQSYIAPAKRNGKWGYIDILGNPVIDFNYESVGFFKESVAWVKAAGRYSYINGKGRKVINESFKWASDFYRNFAFVLDENNEYYYINKKGDKFAKISDSHIRSTVCNGLPCTTDEQIAKLSGNNTGVLAVLSGFAFRFFNGIKIAPYNRKTEPFLNFGEQPDMGLIDEQGNIIKRADGNTTMITYNKNTFYMVTKDNRVKVFDFSLNERLISGMNQQFSIGALGNGGYLYFYSNPALKGFVNDQQEKKTEPVFNNIYFIDDQLTFASDASRFRLIKQDGSYLYDRPSDGAMVNMSQCCYQAFDVVSFMFGAAQPTNVIPEFLQVRYQDAKTFRPIKMVLLDKNNFSEVIPSSPYTDIFTFRREEELLLLQQAEIPVVPQPGVFTMKIRKGLYKIGKGEVVPCVYDTIKVRGSKGLAIVSKDGKSGVIQIETNTLKVPLSYSQLEFFNDTLLIAGFNGKYGLVHTDNRVVLPFVYDTLTGVSYGDEMNITYREQVPDQPFFMFPSLMTRSESFAACTVNDKTGIIDLSAMTELIKPAYDKIFLMNDKLICVNVKLTGNDDEYSFRMINMFGNPFVPDDFKYLRYDESDKIFTGITRDNKLKLINSHGDELFGGDITVTDADISGALEKGDYTIRNAVYRNNGRTVPVNGTINRLVKLTGKVLLQLSGKIIQMNLDNGFSIETAADTIEMIRF